MPQPPSAPWALMAVWSGQNTSWHRPHTCHLPAGQILMPRSSHVHPAWGHRRAPDSLPPHALPEVEGPTTPPLDSRGRLGAGVRECDPGVAPGVRSTRAGVDGRDGPGLPSLCDRSRSTKGVPTPTPHDSTRRWPARQLTSPSVLSDWLGG